MYSYANEGLTDAGMDFGSRVDGSCLAKQRTIERKKGGRGIAEMVFVSVAAVELRYS